MPKDFSGHEITLKTENKVTHPLPSFELLQMQWVLHIVASLSDAAEDLDDDDDNDDEEDYDYYRYYDDEDDEYESMSKPSVLIKGWKARKSFKKRMFTMKLHLFTDFAI